MGFLFVPLITAEGGRRQCVGRAPCRPRRHGHHAAAAEQQALPEARESSLVGLYFFRIFDFSIIRLFDFFDYLINGLQSVKDISFREEGLWVGLCLFSLCLWLYMVQGGSVTT